MMQKTQIILAGKRALLAGLVGGQSILIGCGGTSQDDMRRHAIRRTPSKEVTDAVPPAAGSNKSSAAPPQAAASPTSDAHSEPSAKAAAGDAVASNASARLPATVDKTRRNADSIALLIDAIPAAAPPAEPLSPAERRQWTANNLTQIGKAWRVFLGEKGYFPGPIASDTKQPLLSWRVGLLPYLGWQKLYDAFHLDEPWDSPHNIALLDKIPSVFQSPERFDAKTNYLALSLSGTTVYQARRTLPKSSVEDGVANTLALVEADDEQAVPWTRPAEFPLAIRTPLQSLGNLRENGLFVVWSDGNASWIDKAVDPTLFAKACTIDSGDGFQSAQIASELATGIAVPALPPSETAEHEMLAAGRENGAADTALRTLKKKPLSLSDAQASVQSKVEVRSSVLVEKQPMPAASELKIARDLLRELYQADYAEAKTASQRLQLARKMLDRLPDLGEDLPGQYALLEIVKQISIQAGSVESALNATDHMTARFELQDGGILDTIEKLTRTASDRREQERLLEEADAAFHEFVLAQQYEAAERVCRLAVSMARQVANEDTYNRFITRKQWASEAKDLHKAAEEALATLEQNPEDPQANGDLGKFLCLIKDDWENGLVILSNGDDRSLKRLATMEVSGSSASMRKLELADLWWREAESSSPAFKATMQSRAKYWYEHSLPGLPAGLVRIRVEQRIEEIGENRPRS